MYYLVYYLVLGMLVSIQHARPLEGLADSDIFEHIWTYLDIFERIRTMGFRPRASSVHASACFAHICVCFCCVCSLLGRHKSIHETRGPSRPPLWMVSWRSRRHQTHQKHKQMCAKQKLSCTLDVRHLNLMIRIFSNMVLICPNTCEHIPSMSEYVRIWSQYV